jgi:RNA-binding protein
MSQNDGNKSRKLAVAGRSPEPGRPRRKVSGAMSGRMGGRSEPGSGGASARRPAGINPGTRLAGRKTEKSSNPMQELKPTVWIGKQGLTSTIVAEVISQLKTRKIIKIKWLKDTEIIPAEMARQTGARLIEVRGRTIVLESLRK